MGIFDDLIPSEPAPKGLFDDLIPADSTTAPDVSPRPQARSGFDAVLDEPESRLDTTDDARAARSFGRSAYLSGLVDAPDVPANDLGSAAEGQMAPREDRTRQPVSDLGKRAARGFTEVGAAVPEALAVTQAGGVEARVEDTGKAMQQREDMIRAIEDRLSRDDISDKERAFREQQVADLRKGQGVVGDQLSQMETRAALDAKDLPIYQRGEAIRKASLDLFGTPDPQFDERFMSKLSEGAGNMAGFVAVTLATGVVGGGAAGSALNTSAMYRRALQDGATEEQARTAAYIGSVIGASEVLPIGRALDLIPSKARGKVTSALARRLTNAFMTAGEEGVQEAMAEIANNLTVKGVYDPNQKTFEGAGESALIGAILGGGMGMVVPTHTPVAPQRENEDKERLNSPRLTAEDRASPIPNDVIDDGKAIMEQIESGAPLQPAVPAQPVPPAPVATDTAVPRATAPERPQEAQEAPAAPATLETPPSAPVAAQSAPAQPDMPEYEDMPEIGDDGEPTGRTIRVRFDGDQAKAQVVEPDAPAQADTTPPQPKAPQSAPEARPARSVEILSNDDLTGIETDAETFQYKSGGDEAGVTDRLAGVRTWDTARAGSAIVFEYADGRRVIADGHQRLGLAKRLRAEGQDVEMPVIIRREVDGYSPKDVMVEAALKNIGESPVKGNADPQQVIDAAKVMRALPSLTAEDMNLPRNSALVRDAQSIRNLSDDAFGMVVNEKATVRNAAAVGNAVPDKSAHANILSLLERLKPVNMFQAEQVARQAAAETATSTQQSLFGEEQITESLFLERARVMDVAIKRLRKDKATFNTLLQRGETISGAGNVLNQDANQKRMQEDATVQEYLTRQANTKGPISDALSQAARAVKGGADIRQTVTGFIGDVRRAIEGDRQTGEAVVGDRRPDEQAGAGSAAGEGKVADPKRRVLDARVALSKARKAFDALDAEKKISDADAYFAASKALAEARRNLIDALVERGGRIELKNRAGLGAIITPTGDGFQISYFDERGFSGDTRHDTLRAAVKDAVEQGYDIEAPGLLKEMQKGPKWQSPAETQRIRDEYEAGLKTERTDAGDQTVIPGAEQDQKRSDDARKADQKREMEARAKQSKKGTATPQDGAGPLFGDEGGTQGGLFEDEKSKPEPKSDRGATAETQREGRAVKGDPSVQKISAETFRNWGKSVPSTGTVRGWRVFNDEVGGAWVLMSEDHRAGNFETEAAAREWASNNPSKTISEPKERIEDLGEKIGGARKDTSTPTGPRGSKPKSDTPAWRKRYSVIENWDLKASEADKKKFMILDTKTNRPVRDGYRTKLFDSREEAERFVPLAEVARNHRVTSRQDGTFEIIRTISDRKRVTIKDGFKSRDEAMLYMAENAVEIIETNTRIDDSIHPALEEAIRLGEDRRAEGRDVTGQDFMDVFGFRGVEFGNWNNNAERQHILNQGYDAFLDLAEITGLPPKAISLNGELALAFGARGQGLSGARAHYERDYGVINLTKIKGAGSLAHEWMHALDHYFGRQDGSAKSKKITNARGDEVFDASTSAKDDYVSWGFAHNSGVREEVRDAIKAVMQTIAKRKVAYTEDQSTREKISNKQVEKLDQVLDRFLTDISTRQQYGKKKEPATAAQMKRARAAVDAIKAGRLGEMTDAPTKAKYAYFQFYKPVMTLAEIYKDVRGRQAYGLAQNRKVGWAVDIQNAIATKQQAEQFLSDAKEEKEKFKTVRTEFASEAWKMDQGRSTDYWSTNHELMARAFESYVYDRLKNIEARNDFLSYEKHNDQIAYRLFNVKPYPEGEERSGINAAFERLFDTIKTEETAEGTVRLYQRPLDMFYSPLLRSIEGAKQKQAPAKDWKAILAKMPGVKKTEIEWLGVNEWLDAQDGQVTREDIADFVRESQIEVVEEVGGEVSDERGEISVSDTPSDPDEEYIRSLAEDSLDDVVAGIAEEQGIPEEEVDRDAALEVAIADEMLAFYDTPDGLDFPATVTNARGSIFDGYYSNGDHEYVFYDPDTQEEIRSTDQDEILEWANARGESVEGEPDFPSSFEDYTEDGGENYREILIRVPNLHESGKNRSGRPLREIEADMERLRNGRTVGEFSDAENAEWQSLTLERERTRQEGKTPFVQPGHFEQPNIVVHARVKDRTGPNGEKVLFVEEIQSDLASAWRENSEPPEVTARRRELNSERSALSERLTRARLEVDREVKLQLEKQPEYVYDRAVGEGVPASFRTNSVLADALLSGFVRNVVNNSEAAKDYQRLDDWSHRNEAMAAVLSKSPDAMSAAKQWLETYDAIVPIENDIIALGTEKRIPDDFPDTPFKEEATYTLMVKRLLRMAAEDGYDRLSWTPGYMQAERWNSAAQSVVDSVKWEPAPEGTGAAKRVVLGLEGSENVAMVSEAGIVSGAQPIDGKPLSRLLGPSLAKQIMAEESGEVSGEKITFGDSGYAIAYDQQTRKAVDSLAKKSGAKVYVDKTLPDFLDSKMGQYLEYANSLPKDEVYRRAEDFANAALDRNGANWTDGQRRVNEGMVKTRLENLKRNLDGSPASFSLSGWSDNDIAALFPDFTPEAGPVWSIDITDGLRASAMEPMAILRRGSGIPDRAKVEAILPDLKKRLDKLMLRNVDLRFEAMPEQGATEIDRDGKIAILIGASMSEMATLNHEAIHALRAMNLFTKSEWSVLESEAKRFWMQKYDIAERYGDLSEAAQIEEAIAEAFADYAGRAPNSGISGAFAKIKRFFRALMETLRGAGIRSVSDIFADVDTGRLGRRDRTQAPAEGRAEQRQSSKVRARSPKGLEAIARQTQSAHVPDRAVSDELFAQNVDILRRASGIKGALGDRWDRFRIKIQDEMLMLLRAEKAVERVTGRAIPKARSTYYAIERYASRTEEKILAVHEQYAMPIISLIAKAETPIKLTDPAGNTREGADAVSMWLMARHAKERNAHIASINPKMPDGGSGMTNAEADAIMAEAAAGKHQRRLEQIGALTDRLGSDMITMREDSGLLSAQEALIWRRMYKHYVPLRKFAENDMFDGILNERGTAMGARYNVRGAESKQALGRSSEAFDPLAMLLTQAQEVAIRSEKNIVAKTMFDFAATHPNPALWEISEPETQRFFNKATGQVETRVVGAAARPLSENEMALKINGKERRITFNDQRLARAMGRVGINPLGDVLQVASMFSRYFSAVNTMLSPPFTVVNAFRDMITAQINLDESGKEITGKLRKAALRDWIKALRGAYGGMKGATDTEYQKWFKEYSEVGGRVAFWKMETPEAYSGDFRAQIKRASRGKILGTASRLVLPSTRDNPALAWINRANLAVDNAVRMATYVEARRNGWSKEDAASLSKNLTVNFNRRGEWGPAMNALFPFANAAIQGTHVIMKAMSNRKVKYLVGGMVLFGIANDLLNASLSAEDDDGELEYDQLPNYMSQRNLIFATGSDKTFATIPLPYGYNAFFYVGQQIGKIIRGVKKPGEAAGDVFAATVGAFSPLSGETAQQFFMPTLVDFGNELAQNRDWLGRNIRPENPYGDYGPQSYKEYNASTPSRLLSRGLNSATGGSPIEAGLIDISPEYFDHIFKFLSGGAGRFAGQTLGLAERAVQGTLDQTELYEVPIAKVMAYSSGDYLNQNRYFEFREAVKEARAQAKLSAETGYPMTPEMHTAAGLWKDLSAAEKKRKALDDNLDAIYADDRLTARQREEKVKALRDRKNLVFVRFNKAFISRMGPQGE